MPVSFRSTAGPHLPSTVHQWLGDSRGHWEGDTLVVDTTNYKPRSFMSVSSEKLHVIERFSRSGPETLKYEITIDDPGTWTKPWSLMIPLRHSPKPVYEYACHEGNIGMVGILAGARAEEQAAASGTPTTEVTPAPSRTQSPTPSKRRHCRAARDACKVFPSSNGVTLLSGCANWRRHSRCGYAPVGIPAGAV